MKTYHFISGLPRSGSTLLSGILRQNPDFYADISSPLCPIISNLINTITISENNILIDDEQRKNIIYGTIEGYYSHIKNPVIFDTSRGWTRYTSTLKGLFPHTKILCTVRDIISILNSFEVISSKNPFHTNTLSENNSTVFSRCEGMMDTKNGVVFGPLISLEEGYSMNPEMIHFIEYEELCKNPEQTMRKVYEFLEMPYYSHDFENVEYSNELFDKRCNLNNLHTVKRKVEYNPPRCILPREIVKKYTEVGLEFWRNDHRVKFY